MLQLQEIAQAVGAQNDFQQFAPLTITSVEFDTRQVTKGALFVPLKGNRDGHQFIEQAFAQGAIVTLTEEPLSTGKPHLVVADTLKAMQQLAIYFLKKISPKVVAVTGSNGKTTTKDMIYAVLSSTYQTHKTQGNYNNHIGVPYTILHMAPTTECLVLEMGMDHKGEIEVLSKIGQPDISVITMIGEAHIENLGSREGIAAAKSEIAAGLKKDGVMIMPHDEPLLHPLAEQLEQTVKTFGTAESDIYGKIIAESKDETAFSVAQYPEVIFTIPVVGSYNVRNALIALQIGQLFHIPAQTMQQALASFELTQNRTQWLTSRSGMSLLSDVYNANPTAMGLVLDTFASLEVKGRRLVVLADMRELGDISIEGHRSMANHLDPQKIAHVFLYGEQMKHLANALVGTFEATAIHHFGQAEQEQLIAAIKQISQATDTLLLKGSNGMRLDQVVAVLLEN